MLDLKMNEKEPPPPPKKKKKRKRKTDNAVLVKYGIVIDLTGRKEDKAVFFF